MSNFLRRRPTVDMKPIFSYFCHIIRDEKQFTLAYAIHSVIKSLFGWSDTPIEQHSNE